MAAARLQRLIILLSSYNYDICYKTTKEHCNMDGLSRLPLPSREWLQIEGVTVFNRCQFLALPVTFREIKTVKGTDPILSKITGYVLEGWPKQPSEEVRSHFRLTEEYSIENECLQAFRSESRHSQVAATIALMVAAKKKHPGITHMKALAKSYFW